MLLVGCFGTLLGPEATGLFAWVLLVWVVFVVLFPWHACITGCFHGCCAVVWWVWGLVVWGVEWVVV